MLLIISAEDLGTSEAINNEIFGLLQSGLATSSTVIANAPAFEHAVPSISRFPDCSFGVHLNLTVFRPLTSSSDLEPVLDERGCLSPKLFEVHVTPRLKRALLEELTAQVDRARAAGIPISHFDSHQHVHTLPKLFPILKALQRRFGIRKVRSTINLLGPSEQMTASRALKKQLFRTALRYHYATGSPDGLGNFYDFHVALQAGRLPQFRCLELMTHPGTDDACYNHETELLKSGWQQFLPPGTKLGNYHSISR